MCECTPQIRTLWCGKPGCQPPDEIRFSTVHELTKCQIAFNEQQEKYKKLLAFAYEMASVCNMCEHLEEVSKMAIKTLEEIGVK